MVLCDHCESDAQNQPNLLACGHHICAHCLRQKQNYKSMRNTFSRVITCELCDIMSIIPTKNQTRHPQETRRTLEDSQTLFCRDCQFPISDLDQFLKGPHRVHNVIHSHELIPEINTTLNKSFTSLELQSQALYRQIESYTKQKRRICEEYEQKLSTVKCLFEQAKNSVEQLEKDTLDGFEKSVYGVISEIDVQVAKTKSNINKCNSYLNCIGENLKNYKRESSISTYIQFYLDAAPVFAQQCESLATARLYPSPSAAFAFPKAPDPELLRQAIENLSTLNLFKKQNAYGYTEQEAKQADDPRSYLYESSDSEIDRYFESKRKQLFSYKDDNQINNEKEHEGNQGTDCTGKWNPENRSPLLINGNCYDIEGRISILRKKLQITENGYSKQSRRLEKKAYKI